MEVRERIKPVQNIEINKAAESIFSFYRNEHGKALSDFKSKKVDLKKIVLKGLDSLNEEDKKISLNKILNMLENPVKAVCTLKLTEPKNAFRIKVYDDLLALINLYEKTLPGAHTDEREIIKVYSLTKGTNAKNELNLNISAYFKAARQLLALNAAYQNANQQNKRIDEMKNTYCHGGYMPELLVLKRHEVCTYLHKGFGLKSDVGLNALHEAGSQTGFELEAAKLIQSYQIKWLRESGVLNQVHTVVSPVSRAYETAIHATFLPEVPDSVRVDNHFAEKQKSLSIFASGTPSQTASEVVKVFKHHKFKNVSVYKNNSQVEDQYNQGENREQFEKRRDEAYRRMLAPLETNENSPSIPMQFIVAHGAMNRALIHLMRDKRGIIEIQDSEMTFNFDYGTRYEFMILRKNDFDPIIIFMGHYDRFGQQKIAPLFEVENKKIRLKKL